MNNKERQLLEYDDLLQVQGGSVAFPDSLQGGNIIIRAPKGITSQDEFTRAVESDAEKIFQKYYKPGDTQSIQKNLAEVLNSMKSGSYSDSYFFDPVKRHVIDKFAAKLKK